MCEERCLKLTIAISVNYLQNTEERLLEHLLTSLIPHKYTQKK